MGQVEAIRLHHKYLGGLLSEVSSDGEFTIVISRGVGESVGVGQHE